ncbi:TetR/AcrR family transcriptional regulator [Streptomyces sp. TP-A0874]|uniref:TetR/AcrR family transcriptional regulator n=1 Tax=Streptomyces sp. TP-A0874 TaxID=549819 RepID=UPI000853899F|nr:TetR/AcrR family transcriptional regulator [Streptomyces sp. TP-A0874]
MTTGTAQSSERPLRADARRNHQRLLTEARIAFTRCGTEVALEEVARRAGVGVGTLYRHFPSRQALMAAVFQDEVDSLLARSEELLKADRPCRALIDWLRAIIGHTSTYRGLSLALIGAADDEASGLSHCCRTMHAAGGALLERAQRTGAVRPEIDIDDLMRLTKAIALAVEETPEDPGVADRLLMLAVTGLLVDRGPGHPALRSSPAQVGDPATAR